MRRSIRMKISQVALAVAMVVMLVGFPSAKPEGDCMGSKCDTTIQQAE